MALIKCYECEKEISDKAPSCPHCGAPKEALPPEIEEAEILESVAVVDEPEPIAQETISAPSTEPESVATKDEGFNKVVAIAVGALVFQIARSLGMNFGFLTVIFLAIPYALLVRYGKKQSPQAYAGIIGALVVVFGIAVAAGPGSQRDARWAHAPVNVRSGRSTSDSIVTGLERGERIEVDNLVDGWFRVFRNGEPIGYSASSVLNEGPPSSEVSIPEIEDGNAPLTAPSRRTAKFDFVDVDTEKVLDATYPENSGAVRLKIEVKNTGTCVATLNFDVQLLNDAGFPVTDWFFEAGTMAVGDSKTLSDVVQMARAEFDEVTSVRAGVNPSARCVP
jgi:hypothetical protein